ncbi:MAG TPA: HAMP domain-containing protein [Methylophaga aminisulfidivorans]|uniref:histidine kinase n=2 Tax=root TaxID=1 RepID=A0A7C1VSA4_9GAMM|nr:HAMP domain-containing protein [Methylophaga aminisulfidivorans]
MYKKKIIIFAAFAFFIVLLALSLTVWSTKFTASNITQVNMANSLLTEHLKLSDHSYRLFKQITDEILLGKSANQSIVRNKRAKIAETLSRIRELEVAQRLALGPERTKGSVEDTDNLESAIDEILLSFAEVLDMQDKQARTQKIQFLLEEQIDNKFREAINLALQRQSQLVEILNANIENRHTFIYWSALALAILTAFLAILGSLALIRNITEPVNQLKKGAESLARGDLQYRVPLGFDAEFDAITESFNSMAQNLAEQKQLRDTLNHNLEYEVAKRTDELTQLNQTLQDNDVSRRHFLADISHELRTPLTIIRGEAQVALRKKSAAETDPVLHDALGNVLEQSLLLSRLVDDLLFIARTDSNNLRLEFSKTAINELIADCCSDMRYQAADKQIELHFSQAELPLQASVDAERIRQLLIIVLDNAIKYSPEDTRVSLHSEINNNMLVIVIQDQGHGIEQSELPFIFDRFYRGQKVRRESQYGTGLGLAVAKAITDAHQGRIKASSDSSGFCITIALPLES